MRALISGEILRVWRTDVGIEQDAQAHQDTIPFVIPRLDELMVWSTLINTYFEDGRKSNAGFQPGESYALQGHSIAVLSARNKWFAPPRIFAKSGHPSTGQTVNP